MVGLSVRHRSNMPKKSIIRRTILALLIAVLCAAVLSSCRYLERQKEKRNMERVASEMALAYVEDTYGGKAEVLDVEVGTYEVIFRTEIDSDALVTVSLDSEEFQVYVETRPPQLCVDNRSGLALGKALDEYFRNLYGLPQALEHSVRIYSNDEDFFASYPRESPVLLLPSLLNRRLAQIVITAVDQKCDVASGSILQCKNLIGIGMSISTVLKSVRGPAVSDHAAMDCLKGQRFIGRTLQTG